MTALLQIWRPEAVEDQDDPHPGPFDGVEPYLVATEDEASAIAEDLVEAHPSWRFMVSPVSRWET